MRHRYIVCYDIADPKRLSRVAKVMLGFGGRQQYSVFRCDLSDREHIEMVSALTKVINQREDRVMIVDTGPVEGRGGTCTEYLGQRPTETSKGGPVIV